MSTITFERTEANGAGRFEAFANGAVVGVMTYTRIDEHLVRVEHTEVFAGHEGEGLGSALVARGVSWARKHKQKISPRCSFTKFVFERTPEFSDVWYK